MKLIVLCGLLAVTFAASGRVQQQWQNDAEPFRVGKQYRYRYDTQISSGMDNQVSSHRISAIAKIHFETERVASLQLENIQIGSLNQPMDEPRQLQSSRLFHQKEIQNEFQSELELPCKFDYVDGVVEGIYFSPKESSWTQNIKRAVLNMLQLNLKRRESKIQQWEQPRSNDDDKTTSQTRTFTLPEVTLEGECQTVYSINKVNDEESSNSQLFNVTKSVDFKHCKNVASIRYGPRAEKPTLESQQQEIEANEVDRSTVFRYQLVGTPEKYGVSRVELLSQYVYKTLNAEHEQPLQTIVVSELCLESVETTGKKTFRVQENQESLLYSTSWDLNEKRFYQYGDEEFTRSPFAKVENKAQIAQNLIRKVAQDSQDKSNGINSQSSLKLQQLVQILRMCSVPELKQIAGRLSESKPEETIFFDALAIAGTRNTIAYLVEATLKEEISTSKAVQALQQLTGLPSPSDKQVEQVLRLCKSEIAKLSSPLNQACWLTAGSLIGDLCKETIYESIEESEKQCPRDVKEKFQKALLAEYKQAETVYEKIVALKALGNAAIDLSVFEIEKIIVNQREPSIVRQQAIDALRRLRNQMPRKIQRILLPIFKNVQEQPEIRMTAFSMMMHTLPEKAILDQITFVLFNERSQHVKSFVYTTMKAYSQSPIEVEQEMARHLKSCLKMAKVEQQELRGSRYHRVPIYSQQQQEGLFINWASIFSTNNMLPKHLSISMDAFLNGLLEKNNFEISLTQTDVERYYQQIFSEIYGEETSSSRKSLRGNRRSNSQESGSQLLENVFESLKIQPRRRYRSEESEKTPFGMLCLRIGDLDQVILPISEETMPEVIRNWLKGERPSMSSIASLLEGQRFRQNTVSSFHERSVKIATTCGLPLVMQHSLPVVASVEGLLKARVQSEGIKIELTIQPMIAAVHSQKMELWCPIINIGVESIRAVEMNLPLDIVASISYDNAEKVKITLRFPETKTRLVALTSLPITFTREYDSQTQLHREPKIKTIRNPEMESCLVELNSEETTGFSVNGHFHKPSEMTYQQLLAIATVTENQIVVEFEPMSNSVNGIELTFHGKLFKPTQKTHQPEMSSFYSNKKFENLYEQEMEDYSLESENEREQKLNKYLNKYQPGKIYEHYVKVELQTLGGNKPFKAAADLTAVCDNKWNFCKLSSSVSRSPIYHHENSEWTLISNAQILTPEYVQRLEQLENNKQNKFVVVANAEWGSEKTQKVSLKLQGERAVPQEWSRREWTKMATAFINKYDIVADYKLNEWTRQQLQQFFQLFKIYNYWNMENDEETQGKEGHVFATIVIDPRTRQHLNMTVKAPTQLVRFTNIEMPFSMKPWSLVRHQNARLTDSVSDVVDRVSEYSRDECRVDGKRVRTFDGAAYKAPIHQCYSVIAKDCSDRKNFVVMMKSLEANSEDKKMKIINRDDVYEIEPQSEELIVKINGEKVSANSEQLDDKEIEITDDLVTVKLPQGVTVHFDGKQAVVKMSQMYKNTQCGLCGHYDDDQENEFRTNEDKETDDVKKFHRSYSMLEDSECERRSADKIYEQDSLFGNEKSLSRQNQNDEEDSDYESTFESDEEVENYQIFGKKTTQEDENDDEVSPKKVTQVMEYGHKICFSQKPIKQCPKGTYPESTEQVKVQFSCLNRSSIEARRLSREAKNNDISRKVASHKSSFAETVRSHITCSQL